jgi:hypothetical protein
MTIDELIERLKALPKDVRRRPLMDGKPAVGYRLAPLSHISVEKVLTSNDGLCGMTASELPDMGSYHYVYTYGANDANLRNVTLVVADGNKVGLYDADGKALK